MGKLSKKEKSRLKIMHTAKGLFEKNGIDSVTFAQIAEGADMCRSTVFNHFSNVTELMLAIISQEIEDIRDYCREKSYTGKELIYSLFDKLIEDTTYYPMLATRLINNAILSHDMQNPVKTIEEMTVSGLKEAGYEDEESRYLAIMISGAYFGLVNHYHINDLNFERKKMEKEFHRLLNKII